MLTPRTAASPPVPPPAARSRAQTAATTAPIALDAAALARCARAFGELAGLAPAGAMRATVESLVELAARAHGLGPAQAAALCAALAPWPGGANTAPPPPAAREAAARELAPLAGALGASPGALGEAYEALLAAHAADARKRRGSYYTPDAVARSVVARALAARDGTPAQPPRVVLDPAMGAGRFLLAALSAGVPATALHGIDRDPLAVFVARAAVALAAGPAAREPAALADLAARLRHGDALAPGALAAHGADLVVGNPPWVAYAGRQAAPLAARVRADYRARFRAFAGFPSAHGMFVELAGRALAPGGVLALLVPTQVADLAGYGPTRAALAAAGARVCAPLEELGFGQFEGVTEPTLVLLAVRSSGGEGAALRSEGDGGDPAAPWALTERASTRGDGGASPALSPRARDAFARLASLPRFAPETFGEAGFQTAGALSRTHLRACGPRDPAPPARYSVPLREGRDVEPYHLGPPALALDPDPAALARAGTRLRPPEAYARVAVVIRQTARYPIAAVHAPPCAFRNSLLAGYHPDPWALCALLNSALLRALHLAAQRDGRQEVFPQLKVAHLRALPAPPPGAELAPLGALARRAAAAQTARHDAARALAAEFPALALPRALFTPEGNGEVPSRRDALLRRAPARERERLAGAYDAALERARRAWAEYCAAQGAIDDAVYALYGVAADERA